MNHLPFAIAYIAVFLSAEACSSSSSNPNALEGGSGGAPTGGFRDAGADVAAATSQPCGSFELSSGGYFKSGSWHGQAWTNVSSGTTISPSNFSDLTPGAPLCVQGTVNARTQGGAWAILGIGVDGVARQNAVADAGLDASTGAAIEEFNSLVPVSDGLIVNINNRADSPLRLCVQAADGDQWCAPLGQSNFFPWNSFQDITGSGVAYANEPLISIQVTATDSDSSGSTPFDFCLNSMVEVASWCGCNGGACSCPAGMTSCDGVCVTDTSLNPNNCGTCGIVCQATSACSAGQCSDSSFVGLNNPFALVTDGAYLYMTDSIAGSVLKASLNGGVPVALASGQVNPQLLALDSGHVYWVNAGTSVNDYADGSIMKTGIDGSALTTLASNQNTPSAIAVDATSVYWVNAGTSARQYADGTVMSIAVDGGTPTLLASGQISPSAIAVDGTNVYWTNLGTSHYGFLVDDGSVMKMALIGGMVTTLASGQSAPGTVTVDADFVYWANSGSVSKVPIAGGTATVLATAQSQPFQIVVSGEDLYWTNLYAGSVLTVAVNGGAVTTLATGQNYALGIAIVANDVYWVTYDGIVAGSILRHAK